VYQLVLTGGLVAIVTLASRAALGLFLPRASSALEIAVHANLVVAWSFVFSGISMVLFGVVRSNGAVVVPLLILIVTQLGVRFPMAWVLSERLQTDAIWWSFPSSSLLALLLAWTFYKWGNWRKGRLVVQPATTAPQACRSGGVQSRPRPDQGWQP